MREMKLLADHIRREHLGVELPFACGLCKFTAKSESAFLAHCVFAEHDPNSDTMFLVKINLVERIE